MTHCKAASFFLYLFAYKSPFTCICVLIARALFQKIHTHVLYVCTEGFTLQCFFIIFCSCKCCGNLSTPGYPGIWPRYMSIEIGVQCTYMLLSTYIHVYSYVHVYTCTFMYINVQCISYSLTLSTYTVSHQYSSAMYDRQLIVASITVIKCVYITHVCLYIHIWCQPKRYTYM